jgi:hypothetical protein
LAIRLVRICTIIYRIREKIFTPVIFYQLSLRGYFLEPDHILAYPRYAYRPNSFNFVSGFLFRDFRLPDLFIPPPP